jgi:hypothetical protein
MSDEKKLMVWSVVGVFIVFLLAAGWHFLYSNVLKSGITAAIAPVNESPWEHAKLFFVPAIIWYVILYFIAGRKFPNFVFSHAAALLVMPALMLGLFYAYRLFIPDNLAADIILTFIVIALGQLMAYMLTVSKFSLSGPGYITAAMAIVLGLLVLFTVFTYYPPHCDMFMDQTSGRYGI